MQKLQKKSFDELIISEVLLKLSQMDYQSDQRYAAARLRNLTNKGYGPNYIKQYLNQRGVSISLIKHHLIIVILIGLNAYNKFGIKNITL